MSKFLRFLAGFAVLAIVSAITVGGWAWLNRPVDEVPWPKTVQGFALSPYQEGQDAIQSQLPSEEDIRGDLKLLAGKTHALRTYSTQGSLASIARIAAEFNLNVAQGAWISRDAARNEEEIRQAIELVRKNRNIVRVVIGNEALLRNEIPVEELSKMLDRVRKEVKRPVSTAEPWHVWLKYPELAKHVDYIAVHMLPFWEGISVEESVDYIIDKMKKLEARFPDKKIVIGEVGWPSEGRTRENAVANVPNEALFLRRFIHRAEEEGYIYYVMEAFDQPWKSQLGGAVEAYWGVYDVNRKPKFEFTDPIVRVPGWHLLAGISIGLAALLLIAFYLHSDTLKTRGRFFLALVVYAVATATVYIIYDYSQQYVTLTTVLVGAFLVLGMLGVIAVLIAEAHEWAEAHWVNKRLRMLTPTEMVSSYTPKVSIHVPAYNEPPDMLIATIDALAALDYPDFEVLVIDNNTKDEAVWRPVEAHCATLGPRFRFFHVAPLAGFKAGALNFALRHTAPDAEVVACIDADYQVTSDWLRDLVPPFANPRMAIVQGPQDYRDEDENAFKAMCYAEYRGFFHIGMVTRNERNAIIQHGTMTMVRRDLLERLGGWSEWCITEDAELGLRVFESGYEATYIPDSYGRGLMPDTFIDFKKQRYRWAYGAMQIMRRHWSAIWTSDSALTPGQRYHFAGGWLPWIADGFNLSFNLAALCWSAAMIYAPGKVDPPLMLFSFLPLALFTFKLAKLVHLYTTRVGANLRQTFAAALAGLALSHTIGIAVMKGLFTSNEPFFRTPKKAEPHALFKALASAREETLLMVTLWLAAWGVLRIPQEIGSPDLTMWVAVMLIQSIPYAASLLMSLVSAFPIPSKVLGISPDGYQSSQPGIAARARVVAPKGKAPPEA